MGRSGARPKTVSDEFAALIKNMKNKPLKNAQLWLLPTRSRIPYEPISDPIGNCGVVRIGAFDATCVGISCTPQRTVGIGFL